jgi:hypothetical protein
MLERFFLAVIGLALVPIGVGALSERRFFSAKFDTTFDLGPYHQIVGLAFLCVAALSLWLAIRRHES